jgi:predicted Zn-dependent protease
MKFLLGFCILFLSHIFCGLSQDYQLGSIHFQANGDEVAQPYFIKGLLLLHNFEYADAAQEFEMAQLLDQDFVMAYWGEAMCYNHPLWFQQDFEKGKGALFKLGVKQEERIGKAQSELEKDFIRSVELLFGEDKDVKVRNEKYEQAMADMYKKFNAEEEVAAFYALSILGNCYTGEEKEKYDLAARVLMKLNAANPGHPGALNYLIHLYDDPGLAYKARKLADNYFELSKDSKYGQHAPSHAFLANGDWAGVVKSNEAAWKIAELWVKKRNKSLEDRDYHSLWWLQYGCLQQGKYKMAEQLVEDMNRDARFSKSERMRFHLAMMRGNYLSESGNWRSDITKIQIPTKGFNVSTKNMCFFVDAMTAMELNDFPKVEWFLNQMTDQRMVDQNQKPEYLDFRICGTQPPVRDSGLEQELALAECMEWELRALLALKMQKYEEAIANIKKAVALQDKTRYQPGPPVVLKPSHEIYGEILLAMGNAREAVKQFDLALQRSPNRSLSLLGKYKALKTVGDSSTARQVREILVKNWKNADEQALNMLK